MTVSNVTPAPLNRPEFAASATENDSPESIAADSDGSEFWGEDGFTFADLIDLLNPLHHLPIIGTIYRAITGDEISPGARIAGGMLFGGPIGLASAVIAQSIEETTGRDPGAHAVALLTGEEEETAPATQVAATEAAPAADPVASEAETEAETEIEVAAARATPPALRNPVVAALAPPASPRASDSEPLLGAVRSGPGAARPLFTRRVVPQAVSAAPPSPRPGAAALPRLSPQAFEALMRSIGTQPALSGTRVPATAAPTATPTAEAPLPALVFGALAGDGPKAATAAPTATQAQRRAALELHELLAKRDSARQQEILQQNTLPRLKS
jgi:hypothetical protein